MTQRITVMLTLNSDIQLLKMVSPKFEFLSAIFHYGVGVGRWSKLVGFVLFLFPFFFFFLSVASNVVVLKILCATKMGFLQCISEEIITSFKAYSHLTASLECELSNRKRGGEQAFHVGLFKSSIKLNPA